MILVFSWNWLTSKLKCKLMLRFSVVIQTCQTFNLSQKIYLHWWDFILSRYYQFVLYKKWLICGFKDNKMSWSNTDYKKSYLFLRGLESNVRSMLRKLFQNHIVIVDIFMILSQLRKVPSFDFIPEQLL